MVMVSSSFVGIVRGYFRGRTQYLCPSAGYLLGIGFRALCYSFLCYVHIYAFIESPTAALTMPLYWLLIQIYLLISIEHAEEVSSRIPYHRRPQ